MAIRRAALILAIVTGGSALAADTVDQSFTIRLQRYGRITAGGGANKQLLNIKDPEINSPKSVRFSADGRKIYINSLEGGQTLVYSWPALVKGKTITHIFNEKNAYLFQGETTVFDYPYYQKRAEVNSFRGKPVESELSHGGRFLWVPYYRRDFDASAQSPSAVAIIDTATDEIVRVMPTGPIPKYVAASPDGRFMAIVHWGDNTVGLIDTSSGDPRSFHYVAHLVVEHQLSQKDKAGTDRDRTCGFCLRGTVFSSDSQYLLVARMGGGGVAGFHIPTQKYLGSVMNIKATPRHLVLSPDGQTLYASSNASGFVSAVPLQNALAALAVADGKRVDGPKWNSVSVGVGARTLDITADGQFLFVAVNNSSELVVVHAPSMHVAARLDVDPYAVGLALSPDNTAVVLTSQGRKGQGGGNAVDLIDVAIEYGAEVAPRN